jgi:hypothetical protein
MRARLYFREELVGEVELTLRKRQPRLQDRLILVLVPEHRQHKKDPVLFLEGILEQA